jgi:hypothetical protein
MVNKLELIGRDPSKLEVIAVTDKIAKRGTRADEKTAARRAAKSGRSIGAARKIAPVSPLQTELQFEIGEIERAIYARLVEKVGNRRHWEEWAKDIATIARAHIDRITTILEDGRNTRERDAFDQFAAELNYFSECVLRRRDPEPSGEEGAWDVRIIDALYESARAGQSIALRPVTPERRPTAAQAQSFPPAKPGPLVHAESPRR